MYEAGFLATKSVGSWIAVGATSKLCLKSYCTKKKAKIVTDSSYSFWHNKSIIEYGCPPGTVETSADFWSGATY